MKKTYIAILLALLLVTLCACAPATQSGDTNTSNSTETTGDVVKDSIFDTESSGEGTDDKSFSASAPVNQKDQETTPVEDPTETTQNGTTEGNTDVTTGTTTPGATDTKLISYEEWLKMTPEQQQAYHETFESTPKFYEWYNAEKARYEKENPPIEVGNGPVTIPTEP